MKMSIYETEHRKNMHKTEHNKITGHINKKDEYGGN